MRFTFLPCLWVLLVAPAVLPAATIVLPVQPSAEEVWAGHELACDWELATGQKAILKLGAGSLELGAYSSELKAQSSKLKARSSSSLIFFIGDTARGRRECALPPGADEETFRVRDLGHGEVALRGATPAATAEAVVWFAQHCLGLCWYMPGPLGVQRTRVTGWHGLDATVRPAWLSRLLGGLNRPGETAWAEHNLLRARWTTGHNLAALIPSSQFEAHPDWFPWIDGKRYRPAGPQDGNWQPNLALPAVADEAARQLDIWLTEHPAAENAVLCENDSIRFDQSPATRALLGPTKWFRGRPDYSDLVFAFTNRVAEMLAEKWPGKKLTAYAYYWAEQSPSFPVARNVIPYLTADRAEWFDPAFAAEDKALIARWAKAGPACIGLYDYYYGSPFLVPRVTTAIEAESIRYAYAQGARAFYAEAFPNWALDGPKYWLAAQLLWDPAQSRAALLAGYYADFWRESAAPMRKFYETCERAWMDQPRPGYWLKYYRDESQWRLFPPALCRELRADLDEAARRARAPIVRQRVAFVAEAFAVTESFVNFCAAREGVEELVIRDRLSDHRRQEDAEPLTNSLEPITGHGSPLLLARLEDYLAKKQAFLAAYERQQREEPLAIMPVTLDDYLRNDPAPAAAWTLGQGENHSATMMTRLRDLAAQPGGEGVQAALDWRAGSGNLLFDPGWTTVATGGKIIGDKSSVGRVTPVIGDRLMAIGGEKKVNGERLTVRGKELAGSPAGKVKTLTNNQERITSLQPPITNNQEQITNNLSSGSALVWATGRWQGHGEPVEGRSISLTGENGKRVIRFMHCKRDTFSQWVPAQAGRVYEAEVRVRAKVSPGNATYLLLSWLDASGHYPGRVTTLRLPVGDWSASPVELCVIVQAPPGAVWAGYGLLVENQVGDDFAEFSEPEFR